MHTKNCCAHVRHSLAMQKYADICSAIKNIKSKKVNNAEMQKCTPTIVARTCATQPPWKMCKSVAQSVQFSASRCMSWDIGNSVAEYFMH